MDRLRDMKDPRRRNNKNGNINNNNNDGGGNLFPPGLGHSPLPPNIPQPPPPRIPDEFKLQNRFDILRGKREPPTNAFNFPPTPQFFVNNASNFNVPAQSSNFNRQSTENAASSGNLFGSQTAIMIKEATKEGVVYETPQETVDNYLYEPQDNVELELGEGVLENLGVSAENLLNSANITHQEEDDIVLEQMVSMKLKILLVKVMSLKVFTFFMVGKVKILLRQLNFLHQMKITENLLHLCCLI